MTELLPVTEALEHAQKLNVFTPFGLELPDKLKDIDYYCIGIQLRELTNVSGWARADLALRIKQDFPKDYEMRWTELANRLGKLPSTIANDALVAEKYTQEQRKEWMHLGLSYSHCRIAANIEPVDYREYMLQEAYTEGWSVHRLSRELFGKDKPPSRDIRGRFNAWVDTLPDTDREPAAHYVKLFIDYLDT